MIAEVRLVSGMNSPPVVIRFVVSNRFLFAGPNYALVSKEVGGGFGAFWMACGNQKDAQFQRSNEFCLNHPRRSGSSGF